MALDDTVMQVSKSVHGYGIFANEDLPVGYSVPLKGPWPGPKMHFPVSCPRNRLPDLPACLKVPIGGGDGPVVQGAG